MSISKKYIEALTQLEGWVTVSEWAIKFGEIYPELLENANEQAANQATATTGINQIAARISAEISRGAYDNTIEIDTSERPRKVKYIPEAERLDHEKQEIEDDIAPLRRSEIIRVATQSMSNQDQYRAAEFEVIAKQLKTFFGLDFEVDHSQALLNQTEPGSHHPDNFQLLLKAHNARKNNDNWERFSIDEQIEYIKSAIKLQEIVAPRLKIEMEIKVLESLLERLKSVYE